MIFIYYLIAHKTCEYFVSDLLDPSIHTLTHTQIENNHLASFPFVPQPQQRDSQLSALYLDGNPITYLPERFEGGADAVIDTLMGVVKAGTVVMPTYTQRSLKRAPERDRDEFDPATEPSIDGLITERFRQRRDVIRQPNDPWHPMAVWGRDQKALIEARRGATYSFFEKHGGWTLLVGVGHETHSFVHWMVDETQRQGVIPEGGKIHSRLFPRLEPWFIREGVQKTLTCGLSTLRLVDVVAARGVTLLALREKPDLFDMPATEEEYARPINTLERCR